MYLNQEFLTPQQLAKVAGQLSSMHLAIDPLIRLFTSIIITSIIK